MNKTRLPRAWNGPSPEEFQRQLADLMRQHLGSSSNFTAPQTAPAPPEEEKVEQEPAVPLEFNYLPKELKAYLDRFVIRQEEAKKVLSVALCDHYHHVRLAMEGETLPNYTKQNIILIGPTGVGKTYLIRSIAELMKVPFVKADATKFSETGYVGMDVEDLVRELARQADGNIERAEYGIIYIDEIDKLAASSVGSGRDVSGRGVQTNLLKLMEETEVPARSPQDIAGQFQAMLELTQRKKKSPPFINTKHILFVVSGAFEGFEKIIRQRLREGTIGFAAKGTPPETVEEVLALAQTRDFITYGFEPEFVGRLPVRVVCHSLNVDDLFHVLRDSEGSIVRQYERDFEAYGIRIAFNESGLRRIAELAEREGTGARGLMTVCERLLRDFKFELPSTVIQKVEITEALVENPEPALEALLAEGRKEEQKVARKIVDDFARRFSDNYGLQLQFTEAAAESLAARALDQSKSVSDLCSELFKDFQFGLKLIAQNTGQREFLIDANAVESPEKTLSDWVVASYRQQESKSEPPAGARAQEE